MKEKLMNLLEKCICFDSHPKTIDDIVKNDVIKAYIEQELQKLISEIKE